MKLYKLTLYNWWIIQLCLIVSKFKHFPVPQKVSVQMTKKNTSSLNMPFMLSIFLNCLLVVFPYWHVIRIPSLTNTSTSVFCDRIVFNKSSIKMSPLLYFSIYVLIVIWSNTADITMIMPHHCRLLLMQEVLSNQLIWSLPSSIVILILIHNSSHSEVGVYIKCVCFQIQTRGSRFMYKRLSCCPQTVSQQQIYWSKNQNGAMVCIEYLHDLFPLFVL